MDIITQNTYEVLELVEAGQISAEEVNYLISEGLINPYLFESVLDSLIYENEYLKEESDFESKVRAIKNINVMLAHSDKMSPEKVKQLNNTLDALSGNDENLQRINTLGRQMLHGKGSENIGRFLKGSRSHEMNGIVAHSGDKPANIEQQPVHEKGFVDHIIDAYHKGIENTKEALNHAKEYAVNAYDKGVEHVGKAYNVSKEAIKEHPGIAGAVAGAATAGAAGYAAYRYLKNKKAKARK